MGDAFDDANPPGAYKVDPYSGNSTILVNNFFGIRFNGFDDIHALKDGYACAPYYVNFGLQLLSFSQVYRLLIVVAYVTCAALQIRDLD